MNENMFVLHGDGSGEWEEYDDTYDITIHCVDNIVVGPKCDDGAAEEETQT